MPGDDINKAIDDAPAAFEHGTLGVRTILEPLVEAGHVEAMVAKWA